jgi:hypothetical protein
MSSVSPSFKLHVAELSSNQGFWAYVLSTVGNLSVEYEERFSIANPLLTDSTSSQ